MGSITREDEKSTTKQDVITFGAGPSKVPRVVLERIQKGFSNCADSGISVIEVGHRTKEFVDIMKSCEARIRRLLSVPSNYRVLFLQGGAQAQFDAIPMNLMGNQGVNQADYLVTGAWSLKALKEAKKYGTIREVCPQVPGFSCIPDQSAMQYDPCAAYFYYCDNETMNGVEFDWIPGLKEGQVPIVCDMCSNLLTRPIDVSRYGVIFAGSQKTMGCAGLTLVIIREDLVGGELAITPSILNYRMQVAAGSILNTPPTFTAFAVNEALRWVEEEGGIEEMQKRTQEKCDAIYSFIDRSEDFYHCHVPKAYRSRVNIVLRLPSEDLEKLWLAEARRHGLIGLEGHRTVGGVRISLYNGITMDDVKRLLDFMETFMNAHR
ncbi:Phosphoserine aminotransferase [Clonorchis sinensis]|uniref:phosphoserine transaminase n=1 Tax=Clonorchis sinensis TaxID=79923 RepID=A0A419PD30_CLOSI|nr:Phosphoserine aminotransferase [Clonorchis sinensis]